MEKYYCDLCGSTEDLKLQTVKEHIDTKCTMLFVSSICETCRSGGWDMVVHATFEKYLMYIGKNFETRVVPAQQIAA